MATASAAQPTGFQKFEAPITPAFVSWWLWNMNYHAEHHAWPSIPWHALPAAHRHVAGQLAHESWGYLHLQIDVLNQSNLPDGARPIHTQANTSP